MTIPYQTGRDPTLAELLDTNIDSSTLANGDTLVYNSTTQEWRNGAGGGGASNVNNLGGMNFSNISDSELLKRVDANNVGGSNLHTFAYTIGDTDGNTIYSFVNNNLLGDIRFRENNNTNEYRIELHPNPTSLDSLIITEDGASAKVGINVQNPEETLHIAGTARIDNNSTQSLTFYDTGGGNTRQHGRIELADNGGGADMSFYTRPSGGTEPTSKLTINKDGAIGLGVPPNFGSDGNFLMSKGTGQSPEWYTGLPRIITCVKKTDPQTFTSGGVTKITGWNTPHVDIGTTGWNNDDSRYTIISQGTYRINFKAIISNTGNDTSSLRYLNAGILIYESGGGAPVIQDLDTTILFNVDNASGNAERGSADYTIIRTLDATQFIELQVGSLQVGTGDYKIESAVFCIEQISEQYVAGVGQFLPLTGGTITGAITSPTYITSAIPTLTTEIGYNNSIAVATNIILPVLPDFVVLGSHTLNAGVYIVYGSFTTDGFATYGTTAILHDGTSPLTENHTVVVSGGFTSSYVTDTVVVPVGTTKTIEFRANANVATSPAVKTETQTKYNVVRVA